MQLTGHEDALEDAGDVTDAFNIAEFEYDADRVSKPLDTGYKLNELTLRRDSRYR